MNLQDEFEKLYKQEIPPDAEARLNKDLVTIIREVGFCFFKHGYELSNKK